jgi:hypothetical protein
VSECSCKVTGVTCPHGRDLLAALQAKHDALALENKRLDEENERLSHIAGRHRDVASDRLKELQRAFWRCERLEKDLEAAQAEFEKRKEQYERAEDTSSRLLTATELRLAETQAENQRLREALEDVRKKTGLDDPSFGQFTPLHQLADWIRTRLAEITKDKP